MPAKSKQQQKFMGIVRAIQKGDEPASKFSKDAQDAADDMKKKDVEKFASTKHKGLPKKVEQYLRQQIRKSVEEIIEEDWFKRLSSNDQKKYLKDHPNSKKAKQVKANKSKVKNTLLKGLKSGGLSVYSYGSMINQALDQIGDYPDLKKKIDTYGNNVPSSKGKSEAQYQKEIDKYNAEGEKIKKDIAKTLKKEVKEDYVETCGYTQSADGKKLKTPGATGEEDRHLKEASTLDEALTGGDRKVLMVIGREIKDNILKKHPNVKGQQLMKVISSVFMSMRFTPDNINYKNFKKYFPKRYNDKLVKRLGDRLASENDRVRQTFFKKVVGESVNESYTLYHKGRPVTGFYTNAFPITKVVGTSTRSYISFKSEKEIKDDFKRVLSDVSKDDRFTKQDVQKLATMFKRMKIRKNESVNEARLDPKQLLQQLGGNRFIMMVGAKNLVVDKSKNELHMKIGRNSKGVSHVRIRLSSMDLYDMEFLQVRAGKIKIKSKEKGVYADQLGKMFKKNTGMNVRL